MALEQQCQSYMKDIQGFKFILNTVKIKYLLTLPVGVLLTETLSLRTAVLTMKLASAKEM